MAKKYAAVILAGGAGLRMGGVDKPLEPLCGRPMITHVIDTIKPQTDRIAIAGRMDAGAYDQFGLPVLPDQEAYRGPISGIHSAMRWARTDDPSATHVLIVPADTPFLPDDLLSRLAEPHPEPMQAVIAASQTRAHYAIGLWPLAAESLLRTALTQEISPSLKTILGTVLTREVIWPARMGDDPFFNINTREALELAEQRLILAPRPKRAGP